MRVIHHTDHMRCCDNCNCDDYMFEIDFDDGTFAMYLCKKCLLKLFKAIIERD